MNGSRFMNTDPRGRRSGAAQPPVRTSRPPMFSHEDSKTRRNPFLVSCLRVFVAICAGAGAIGRAATTVQFTDITQAAGVRFVHNSGAFGKKFLPETIGSGVVVLDADGDGWQDLLFINSTNWPGRPQTRSLPALYRNNRNGTFTDITAGSGLDVE